jgi:hypothetical protein
MTDIMPQRPDSRADAANTPQNPTQPTPTGNADDDPLSHLHKMSTTAGLGTTEYVAINPLAVATFFLGLASSLALLDNTLLAVPVLTVVIAIVALRQVVRSGGTQAGRGLAILGLVLALAFSGIVVARSLTHELRTRHDTEQIDQLVNQISQDLTQGKADAAYARFSGRFTALVSPQEFAGRFEQLKSIAKLKSLKSNGRLNFRVDPDTGQTTATGMAITEFESGADRLEMYYRKDPSSGAWTIDAIPQFFEEKQQQKTAGGAR